MDQLGEYLNRERAARAAAEGDADLAQVLATVRRGAKRKRVVRGAVTSAASLAVVAGAGLGAWALTLDEEVDPAVTPSESVVVDVSPSPSAEPGATLSAVPNPALPPVPDPVVPPTPTPTPSLTISPSPTPPDTSTSGE